MLHKHCLIYSINYSSKCTIVLGHENKALWRVPNHQPLRHQCFGRVLFICSWSNYCGTCWINTVLLRSPAWVGRGHRGLLYILRCKGLLRESQCMWLFVVFAVLLVSVSAFQESAELWARNSRHYTFFIKIEKHRQDCKKIEIKQWQLLRLILQTYGSFFTHAVACQVGVWWVLATRTPQNEPASLRSKTFFN